MNRTLKITTIIFLIQIIFWTIIWGSKFETFPIIEAYVILLILLLFSLSIGFLFRRIFRNKKNEEKLQWIPNTINMIWIFGMLILIINDISRSVTNEFKWNREQKRIESSVKNWIGDNAEYPGSYQSIKFSFFTETTNGLINKDSLNPDPRPVSDFIKSEKPEDKKAIKHLKYAYYFISHTYLLKNKSGATDTINSYFQLTSDLKIKNIRMLNESGWDFPMKTSYTWRKLYGNDKHNLELELNGNSDKTYLFRSFDKDGAFIRIIPYSNGKINGAVYYFRSYCNLGALLTYKNGIRNGLTLEICPNKTLSFKGYTRNGEFYGLSIWWHCNGQKSLEGIRVHDKNVGTWKYWDEKGILTQTKEYGNKKLLDSL